MLQDKRLYLALAEQEKNKMVYWERFDHFVDLRMMWRASTMRHLFHILPGQSILEIGAGNGKFTLALSRATKNECDITAVVFSTEYKNFIESAKGQENLQVLHMEDFPAQLNDQKFDYIVAHNMLEDETRNGLLYTLKDLLKPGGGLLLFEPNPWNPYYRTRRVLRQLLPLKWKRPADPVSLNRLQIFSVLSHIGYTQINAQPYDFLYAPIPKFLTWPAKHISLILENCPYLRNFAGSLYIWGYNLRDEGYQKPAKDLCEHQIFFGKISFVIPCHNEESNIAPLIDGLKNFYGKYIHEIIIVDDNSSDGTSRVAEELAQRDHRICVLKRLPPNGVGRALRDGIQKAQGEYIVVMDCDFKEIIPEMRDLFDAMSKGYDVVVGSRFSRESVILNYPFTKILANRSFHILANVLFLKHFRDISNNLKILHKDFARNLIIESNDFAANAEIGLKAILGGYKVYEVPISWINRSVNMGLSSFKLMKTGPNYFKLLLHLFARRIIGGVLLKWKR